MKTTELYAHIGLIAAGFSFGAVPIFAALLREANVSGVNAFLKKHLDATQQQIYYKIKSVLKTCGTAELAMMYKNPKWPSDDPEIKEWFYCTLDIHEFNMANDRYGYIKSLVEWTKFTWLSTFAVYPLP